MLLREVYLNSNEYKDLDVVLKKFAIEAFEARVIAFNYYDRLKVN